MEKLTDDQIASHLKNIVGWKISNEKWLEKKYRFGEYLKGVEFVQAIATLSEEVNHHPFIAIDYKLVTLKLTSWRANGLTELDFELVKRYDEIFDQLKRI
ncbi:4a-hydroxytetrahydrobiopterin dehydratase [Bacillus sp. 31A1R]|uniref:4a-hydroxytetrahydrobiopterin dehydratase n=1 Tax=Robertmurraya mangrovi TaxID=3098077 RepID=A0ABU5IZS4_9BACI|nr:4a-hydroxytetrahydrobiopterin dehydratase [Bacillus sp. 31A1R]MDZ5472670.1 4a-hydroxytetrahydrobiopterin dehydratase [Bacillus sp. 31A1R]